ncbi:hypothetical protein [Nereida sp. MMG025]|uniref:hypothetical protein n=1 Tax=Nereida sp. MMG025 TaxID=2909981 RepID=UPI001F2A7F2A|nr:hypothetical protein [Nereida sp. MMG025]MCF6446102.1 hypothetical protein [Nereida sp. MMG025]
MKLTVPIGCLFLVSACGGGGISSIEEPISPPPTFLEPKAGEVVRVTMSGTGDHLLEIAQLTETGLIETSLGSVSPSEYVIPNGFESIAVYRNASDELAFFFVPTAESPQGTAIYSGFSNVEVIDSSALHVYSDTTAATVLTYDFSSGNLQSEISIEDGTMINVQTGEQETISGQTITIEAAHIDGTESFELIGTANLVGFPETDNQSVNMDLVGGPAGLGGNEFVLLGQGNDTDVSTQFVFLGQQN